MQKLQKRFIEFTTLEEGLYLKCEASRRGAVTCAGKAVYQGNILEFSLSTDFPSLSLFMRDLKRILNQYPLKGKR